MKLTEAELDAIREGDLTLKRKKRERKDGGKHYRLSAKRGEVMERDGEYVRVIGFSETETHWLIRLEKTGSWAVPKPDVWDSVIPEEDARRILNGPRPEYLMWPSPCPVAEGQIIRLADDSVEVTIGRPAPIKGENGFKTRIHIADFRAEAFLRRSLPATGKAASSVTRSDTESARMDGAYTGHAGLALDAGEHDEGPGDGWKDRGAVEREAERQKARGEREDDRQAQAMKSRVNRLLRGLDPAGKRVMLARLEALCKETEMKEAA